MRGAGAYQASTFSTPFPWTCPEDVGTQIPVTGGEVAEFLVKTLNDTVTQPVYDAERKWNSRWGIFHVLWENDSIRTADSLLTAFHDSSYSSNLGRLALAARIIGFPMAPDTSAKWAPLSGAAVQTLHDSLSAISSGITPEAALKDVLVIAVEHLLDTALVADSMGMFMESLMLSVFPDSTFTLPAMGRKALSSAHRSVLEEMAEECPYEFGPAVYMARAMLSHHDMMPYMVEHECETPMPPPSEKRGEEDEETMAEGGRISLYPNPAHSSLFVELSLEDNVSAHLELYGITGNLLGRAALGSGKNTVDISAYASGLYFFKVMVNGRPEHSGKQVIMR